MPDQRVVESEGVVGGCLPCLPFIGLFTGQEAGHVVDTSSQAMPQALEIGYGYDRFTIGLENTRHLFDSFIGIGEMVQRALAYNPVEGPCSKRQSLAYPLDEELTMEVRGRDLVAGLPKMITVSSEEVREALAEPIAQIVEAIRITLERTPPELSADLMEKGLIMAGGGSLLRGLDKLISEETGLPVHISEDPLTAVALGTGKVLSEIRYLKRLAVSPKVER